MKIYWAILIFYSIHHRSSNPISLKKCTTVFVLYLTVCKITTFQTAIAQTRQPHQDKSLLYFWSFVMLLSFSAQFVSCHQAKFVANRLWKSGPPYKLWNSDGLLIYGRAAHTHGGVTISSPSLFTNRIGFLISLIHVRIFKIWQE